MQTVDMTEAEYRNYMQMRERGLSRIPSTHLLCGFSPAEIGHLLTLLADAKREGGYYGNYKQYWTRHDRIMQHLTHNAQVRRDSSAPERTP
jgi:hypothetical protein